MSAHKVTEAELAVLRLGERIGRDRGAPQDRRVRVACHEAELVVEFVARSMGGEVDKVIGTAARKDQAYAEALGLIHGAVTDFDSCLLAVEQAGPKDELVARLSGLATTLRDELDRALTAFAAVIDEVTADDPGLTLERAAARTLVDSVRSQLGARRLLREMEQASSDAQKARDEAVRARDVTKQAAGDVSAATVGELYATYADKEAGRADRLRWAAAVLLIAVAVGALGLNFWLDDVSLAAELVRLSATIPVALLAGYCVRESTRHRQAAKWADDLAIAMRTLPAYTESLDDVVGLELRRALGMRAFGLAVESPVTSVENGPLDGLSQLLGQADGLAASIREIAQKSAAGK